MESMDKSRERFKVSERETEELKHHTQALEEYTSTRSVLESLFRMKSYGWVMLVGGMLLLLALGAYSAPSASSRTKGAKVEVALGPLIVDVPDGKGGVRTIEVTVPESLTDVPVRVRIPVMDVEVPSNAGVPRRVATPAIEVGLFDPDAEDVPTRVLVSVPVEAADEARRVRVPVSEQ
jgi:hypothetical protein